MQDTIPNQPQIFTEAIARNSRIYYRCCHWFSLAFAIILTSLSMSSIYFANLLKMMCDYIVEFRTPDKFINKGAPMPKEYANLPNIAGIVFVLLQHCILDSDKISTFTIYIGNLRAADISYGFLSEPRGKSKLTNTPTTIRDLWCPTSSMIGESATGILNGPYFCDA